MLKSFFILLFSLSLFADTNIDSGDRLYFSQNYLKAIEFYQKALEEKHPKARIKLITTYLKLGDNFFKIENFKKAKLWYEKALELNSKNATLKLSNVYEKEADRYFRIKEYKTAKELYSKAYEFGNRKVNSKIKKVDSFLSHEKQLKDDTRKIVKDDSPLWTKSTGRILIPTNTKKTNKGVIKDFKKCSANLVSLDSNNSSNIIVTASHCLSSYNKNAGKMKFIIRTNSNDMIQRFVKIYKDSNFSIKKINKVSDYAILILDKPIKNSDVKPLVVLSKPFHTLQKEYKKSFASLVGFSGDIGEYGAKLTYDPKCELFYFNKLYGKSNCKGFKGASGGSLVLNISKDGKSYETYFAGVVSHFRNKDFKQIYFSPTNLFYEDLKKAIKENKF